MVLHSDHLVETDLLITRVLDSGQFIVGTLVILMLYGPLQ